MKKKFEKAIANADSIAIAAHIHPDGDAVGSVFGLKNYIEDNFKGKKITVYMEGVSPEFSYIKGSDDYVALGDVKFGGTRDVPLFDLFICLDCGSEDRLGEAIPVFRAAKEKWVIDHHMTNTNFGDVNFVDGECSSASEMVCLLLDPEKITIDAANPLYTGIAHDTGIFKYSCTGKRTMEIAGMLMGKGVNTAKVIDCSFFEKSFTANRLLGEVLCKARLLLDGKLVVGYSTFSLCRDLDAKGEDHEGIVEQLRNTKGIEVACYIKEQTPNCFKVSLRSCEYVDVASIAVAYGGGGHKRAAGFSVNGKLDKVIAAVQAEVESRI